MLSHLCLQLITLSCQLLWSFFSGLLPLCIVRFATRGEDPGVVHRKNRIVSFLLHFGGGVFLSTCFLILIPESRERFAQDEPLDEPSQLQGDSHHHDEFPMPEFIVLCGFFGSFALAEFIKLVVHIFRRKRAKKHDPRVRFCSCAKRHTECSRTYKAGNPEQTIFGIENSMYPDCGAAHGENSTLNRPIDIVTPKTSLLQSSILDGAVPSYGSVVSDPPTLLDTPIPPAPPPMIIANDGNVTIIHRHPTTPSYTDNITNGLLLAALSLYAVIRGAELGQDVGHAPWIFVLLDCLQQSVLVFVVGSVVVPESKKAWPVVGYVLPLTGAFSLGILLAAVLNEETLGGVTDNAWGVLLSVVCGSLLHLIFCDLFRRDGVRKMCGSEKFVGFTIGAALVALLLYLTTIL